MDTMHSYADKAADIAAGVIARVYVTALIVIGIPLLIIWLLFFSKVEGGAECSRS